MTHEIKEYGEHKGIPWIVIYVNGSHHCGYVGLNAEHPLYKRHYDDMGFWPDIHGGVTYSKGSYWGTDDEFWWFGFDCAHAGDKTNAYSLPEPEGSMRVFRTVEYVKEECIKLIEQLCMPEFSERRLRNIINNEVEDF